MRKSLKNVLLLSSTLVLSSLIAVSTVSLTSCEISLNQLVVETKPTKTTYKVGEKFSLEGIVVYSHKIVDGLVDQKNAREVTSFASSIKEGSELKEKGTFKVTITAKDARSASFDIIVGESITYKKLKITTAPSKLSYKVGEKLVTRGLSVSGATYDENNKVIGGNTPISDYEVNPSVGYKFKEEGSFMITISKEGYESATFTVSVLTGDIRLVNIISRLANSNNYSIDIYNSVPTTLSTLGFHYNETFTENYFIKTTYKKSATDEKEEDRYSGIESTEAYVSYARGAYKVSLNGSEVKPGKQISSKNNWWDANLVTSFKSYALSSIPTASKSGKFVFYITLANADKVAGSDNASYEETAKLNPFVNTFLSMCGWSASLFGVMTRMEVTTDGESTLEMMAYFGPYGYTSVKLVDFGNASNPDLDSYISDANRSFDTTVDPFIANNVIKNALKNNNFTIAMSALRAGTATIYPGNVYMTNEYVSLRYDESFIALLQNQSTGKVLTRTDVNDYAYINITENDGKFLSGQTGLALVPITYSKDAQGNLVKTFDESNAQIIQLKNPFSDFTFTDPLLNSVLNDTVTYDFPYKKIGKVLETEGDYAYLGESWETNKTFSSEGSVFLQSHNQDVIDAIGTWKLGSQFSGTTRDQFTSAAIAYTYEYNDKGELVPGDLQIWALTPQYSGFYSEYTDLGTTSDADVESFMVTNKINGRK